MPWDVLALVSPLCPRHKSGGAPERAECDEGDLDGEHGEAQEECPEGVCLEVSGAAEAGGAVVVGGGLDLKGWGVRGVEVRGVGVGGEGMRGVNSERGLRIGNQVTVREVQWWRVDV